MERKDILDASDRERVEQVLRDKPLKVVLSNLRDKTYPYKKTVIHKIIVRNDSVYQIERFTEKQVFHENIRPEELGEAVAELFPVVYGQMNIFDECTQSDFKITKKGKLLFHRQQIAKESRKLDRQQESEQRRIALEGECLPGHNRKKKYLLEEGMVIPPLVDLGIFTKEGKVVRSMYDKYKQINRFLELVEDVVKDYPNREHMHIIDFGCGKSYLTFILYYYFVECKGYDVHMTGLGLKEDVIRKCNETAKKYHYENLHFELGDINGYQTTEPVDMVVTLHACDTATDYALYNAIRWKAGMILSVPCCQHELNSQMKTDHFTALTKYGIVKERVAALMTDSIRGCLLEASGYRTQLLEFIDIAHSPKNILIRAVRGHISGEKRKRSLQEAVDIMKEFSFQPTLYQLLEGERNNG